MIVQNEHPDPPVRHRAALRERALARRSCPAGGRRTSHRPPGGGTQPAPPRGRDQRPHPGEGQGLAGGAAGHLPAQDQPLRISTGRRHLRRRRPVQAPAGPGSRARGLQYPQRPLRGRRVSLAAESRPRACSRSGSVSATGWADFLAEPHAALHDRHQARRHRARLLQAHHQPLQRGDGQGHPRRVRRGRDRSPVQVGEALERDRGRGPRRLRAHPRRWREWARRWRARR